MITDNKTFWKTVLSPFSVKNITQLNQLPQLKVTNLLIRMIALQIPSMISLAMLSKISPDTNSDPIINAVNKYTNHPTSIRKIIAEEQNDLFSFEFTPVQKKVYKEINLLNPSEAFPKDAIPPQFIKGYPELFAIQIENDFNVCVESCVFPTNQKHVDVTPVYKNGDRKWFP